LAARISRRRRGKLGRQRPSIRGLGPRGTSGRMTHFEVDDAAEGVCQPYRWDEVMAAGLSGLKMGWHRIAPCLGALKKTGWYDSPNDECRIRDKTKG